MEACCGDMCYNSFEPTFEKNFIGSSLNVGAVKEKSNVPVRILFLFDLQLEKLRHDKPFCLWFFQCLVPAKINVHFVLQSTKMSKKTFYYPLLFCFLRYFLNFTKFLKKICNKIFWFLFFRETFSGFNSLLIFNSLSINYNTLVSLDHMKWNFMCMGVFCSHMCYNSFEPTFEKNFIGSSSNVDAMKEVQM